MAITVTRNQNRNDRSENAEPTVSYPFVGLTYEGFALMQKGEERKFLTPDQAKKLIALSVPWAEQNDTARRAIVIDGEIQVIIGGLAVVGAEMGFEKYSELAKARGWTKVVEEKSSFDLSKFLA